MNDPTSCSACVLAATALLVAACGDDTDDASSDDISDAAR